MELVVSEIILGFSLNVAVLTVLHIGALTYLIVVTKVRAKETHYTQ